MPTHKVEIVKEDLLSLVGQIDVGDITDIDVYWEALGYSLFQVLKKYDKRASVNPSNIEDIIGQLSHAAKLSDYSHLITLTKEIKEICMRGSTSEIDDDDLSTLQNEVNKFEKEFEKLLKEISI